jgi:glycosyltransferase involved in cell wall biosynthesis
MIEAMASGLPIVSTDAGGIRDIVGEKQTKYIIDREDRDAFSDKLLELTDAPAVRLALAIENYETAKRFSTERVAGMYIKTIFGSS